MTYGLRLITLSGTVRVVVQVCTFPTYPERAGCLLHMSEIERSWPQSQGLDNADDRNSSPTWDVEVRGGRNAMCVKPKCFDPNPIDKMARGNSVAKQNKARSSKV